MKTGRIPLLSFKKAFGKQNYLVFGEDHKKTLLNNPLVNGALTVGPSFVIVGNTLTWEIEVVTGDTLSLSGYTNEEIYEMQGEFIINYNIPEHASFNLMAVKSFMQYANECPEEQRNYIFATYFYKARKRSGEQIIVQHQSFPLVFDKNKIPYVFCNLISDITYLEPHMIPQAIMVNKYSNEVFHFNNENNLMEQRESLFTPREREIIKFLGMGKTSREIALLLKLSYDTVRTHRKNIMAKAGTNNTASLVKYALMNGVY